MHGLERERLENQDFERTLYEVRGLRRHGVYPLPSMVDKKRFIPVFAGCQLGIGSGVRDVEVMIWRSSFFVLYICKYMIR